MYFILHFLCQPLTSIRVEETEELWRASASPEETFSDAEGANENGEWPVEIVGEEVDANGAVRCEPSVAQPRKVYECGSTDTKYVNLPCAIHPIQIIISNSVILILHSLPGTMGELDTPGWDQRHLEQRLSLP